MKLEVNITKTRLFFLILSIFAIVGTIFAFAYNQPIPNPGHGGNTVWVNVNGTEMTLQEAIDQSKIGGAGNTVNNIYQSLGITFINRTVCTNCDTDGAWAMFDASSFIPSNAKAVIIEGAVSVTAYYTASYAHPYAFFRLNSTSPEYKMISIDGIGSQEPMSNVFQGIYPMDSSKKFYYRVDGGSTWEIKIVGYVTSSGTDGSNGFYITYRTNQCWLPNQFTSSCSCPSGSSVSYTYTTAGGCSSGGDEACIWNYCQ